MNRIFSLPLRLWLPVFTGSIFGLLLLVLTAWHYQQEVQRSEAQAYSAITFTLAETKNSIEASLRAKLDYSVEEQIALLGSHPEVQKLALIDSTGVVRFSSQRRLLGQAVVEALGEFDQTDIQRSLNQRRLVINITPDHDFLLAYQPIRWSPLSKKIRTTRTAKAGVLLLRYDLRISQAQLMDEITTFTEATFLIVVVLMVFMMLILRRRLTQPLEKLLEGVKRISVGNFDVPVEVPGHGELAELADALNRMQAELINANAAVRESEQRLLLATASASLGVWDLRLRDGALVWDERMYELYEITRGASSNNLETWTNSLHPDDKARTINDFQAALVGSKDYDAVFRILCPSGALKYIKANAVILRGGHGAAERVLGTNADVTESYRTLQTIQKSEARYRTLVDSAPFCIHELDLQGRLTSMNPAGLAMMEVLDEEAIRGVDYVSCVVAKDASRVSQLLENAQQGESSSFEFTSTNGCIFQSSFVPIKNASGSVSHLMGITQDITERKQAENELITANEEKTRAEVIAQKVLSEVREAKDQLDKTQQLANLGSWELNLESGQLTWSNEVYRLFGMPLHDSIASYEAFLAHVHPDDRDKVDSAYADSVQNEEDGYEIEHRIIRDPCGEVRHVYEKCEHVKDASGKIIRSLGMVQDITELSQTQTALQSSFAELSFQKLAIDEHAIVSITNVKGDITYVNDKFCEISGYSREELMGQNHRMVRSGEHSLAFYKKLWRTISSGKTWHGEIKNLKKGGDYYWVAATIIPSLNDTGKPMSYIAIRTDVTQIKSTEALLRRSQKMESIGELAGGIAHDFNNLLGIIVGNLDLIGLKMESGSKLERQLEAAQNAALRGASMTRRLLNFSRQSAELNSPVDIASIVYEFEEFIRKSLTASIAIEIHCADDVWMVELNPGDFEDVMINLSLNARDAMPEGGSLILEIKNTVLGDRVTEFSDGLDSGEYVEVSISDTGAGMSKEVVEKIFEPFFTTRDKGKGTGLGLAMVYGFVKRAHGHISVDSTVGVGTTFRMFLPRATSMVTELDKPDDVVVSPSVGTETILIVDDELALTSMAKSILEDQGYTTVCAHTGHEALQVLENNSSIDLVFSDVVMPGGMSGLDLADVITKEYPGVKILLTSGFADAENRSRRVEASIYKIVAKPYRAIELASRVRETLDEVS